MWEEKTESEGENVGGLQFGWMVAAVVNVTHSTSF